MTGIKLTHPAAKNAIEVRDDQAEMYKSQGWVEVASAKPVDEKPTTK